MRWASRRQFLYALAVFLFFAILAGAGWFFFVYTPPTCADGIQNQNEEGVDCNGVCSKLCVAPKIEALWVRAVPVAPGVYHAVASVKNPEDDAEGRAIPYTFSLFDAKNILIAERRGSLDLRPGETRPLFEANIITGERIPARTFVVFGDSPRWNTADRADNPLRVISQEFDEKALRLSALIENVTPTPVSEITISALLYDENEILIGASETKIDTLSPRTRREVSFTWQQPFSAPVLRVEVVPRYR